MKRGFSNKRTHTHSGEYLYITATGIDKGQEMLLFIQIVTYRIKDKKMYV